MISLKSPLLNQKKNASHKSKDTASQNIPQDEEEDKNSETN
jgi:hypothetical protein